MRASAPGTIGAASAMAGLIAIAFIPVLLGGQSFYHLDTYFEHVPFWHFAAQTVANGEWPWWTPNIRATKDQKGSRGKAESPRKCHRRISGRGLRRTSPCPR